MEPKKVDGKRARDEEERWMKEGKRRNRGRRGGKDEEVGDGEGSTADVALSK